MNDHDSLRMRQQLLKMGMEPVSDPDQADLLIINSCSVRAKPENKAISETGRHKRLKKSRGARIFLAGCVAKQLGQQLVQMAPYLDAVIGPDQIYRLPEIVDMASQGKTNIVAVDEHDFQNPCFVPLGPVADQHTSAAITIMKGCNNFCSYCIVPYVRGRETSRPMHEILEEADELARRGYREITLLGQNVNSYRDDNGVDFPTLLKSLDRQGLFNRIRFTTSHPKDVSDRLVEAMATSTRICQHIHLGLQSGSDKILKLMNRGYTRLEFLEKIKKFRQRIEGVSITTDIIVGFPYEEDSDFQQTIEIVQKSGFELAFSFKYSPRPYTAAAEFEDNVREETKISRLEQLQRLLSQTENEGLMRMVGATYEVLVEGASLRDKRAYTGRTRCNRVVNFKNLKPLSKSDLVTVCVTEVRGHTLWGEGKYVKNAIIEMQA